MRSAKRAFAALAIASTLSGCAVNTAPPMFLPNPTTAQRSVRGGWLNLEIRASNSDTRVANLNGELLAITGDSLWVEDPTRPRQGFVVARNAVRGDLIRYDWSTSQGALVGYTLLGVASTVSNGVILILTAPMWAATGTIGGAVDSYAARTSLTARDETAETQLRAFSRFPLGIPRGFDSAFVRLPCVGREWPCFSAPPAFDPDRH